MELIPHKHFGEIRLRQFLTADDIRDLDHWEAMDEDWVGEAVGFTEVLRPAHRPDVVRLVALDLDELTAETQRDLLSALQLPLQRGMSLMQLTAILGKPVKALHFAAAQDRSTYVFKVGFRWRYTVECTVRAAGGLNYLTVMADPRRDR